MPNHPQFSNRKQVEDAYRWAYQRAQRTNNGRQCSHLTQAVLIQTWQVLWDLQNLPLTACICSKEFWNQITQNSTRWESDMEPASDTETGVTGKVGTWDGVPFYTDAFFPEAQRFIVPNSLLLINNAGFGVALFLLDTPGTCNFPPLPETP